MARDNKTIGKFKLGGIKRAPAGVPQIEVTFDIDANGILTVSAKDLGTGKQQSITITANDRMSEEEIAKAMYDAQMYAGQDQIRRDALALSDESKSLLAKTQQAMKNAGKSLEKTEQKQLKSDCVTLEKCLKKIRLDKVSETDVQNLRAAKQQLEASSARVREIFGNQ